MNNWRTWLAASSILFTGWQLTGCGGGSSSGGDVIEFRIDYPTGHHETTGEAGHTHGSGSTHEITFNRQAGGQVFWITGPAYDYVAEVELDGTMRFHEMPAGSAPHGIDFDDVGNLWVALEGTGELGRLDEQGQLLQRIDLGTVCATCTQRIDPHGLGIGADGQTVWYTGKTTDVIGKVTPDGTVTTYPLPTTGSFPIYIRLGPDGNMWFTELTGNRIGRVTQDGQITQFDIPTPDSRPIAIVPDPNGNGMWFTEEAGNNVARIDANGVITEFAVPKTQENVILAGLAFDSDGNLWVQQYVDATNDPEPRGDDHVIKIDRAILTAAPADLSGVELSYFKVPSSETVLHRIIEGPDGDMWFTELGTDTVGTVER